MEDKKLNRVFDRVKLSPEREEAMLADLLNGKKEVSSMKQTNRRRIPAAALVAAALVVALAGTALAAEYFGRVNVTVEEEGYSLEAHAENIPLSSLSEEVLERGKTVDRMEALPFDSWEEAEAFLGLEIAGNARLEQMKRIGWGVSTDEKEDPLIAPCVVMLRYQDSLPYEIHLYTSYREGDFGVSEQAVLLLEDPTWDGERSYNFLNPMSRASGKETYVTPSGMEATIITSHPTFREDWTITKYEAEFILNGAFFTVSTQVNEGESGESALAGLKEVLDAYE